MSGFGGCSDGDEGDGDEGDDGEIRKLRSKRKWRRRQNPPHRLTKPSVFSVYDRSLTSGHTFSETISSNKLEICHTALNWFNVLIPPWPWQRALIWVESRE